MSAPAIAPYRSPQPVGHDGFAQLLRAEWTKLRTVRGWVIGRPPSPPPARWQSRPPARPRTRPARVR